MPAAVEPELELKLDASHEASVEGPFVYIYITEVVLKRYVVRPAHGTHPTATILGIEHFDAITYEGFDEGCLQ